MFFNKKAQSTLEYALLIVAIVAALAAVQVYVKRGFQGRMKQSADELGRQFEPSDTFSQGWRDESTGSTITTEKREAAITAGDGTTTPATVSSDTTASETVKHSEEETWGTTPPVLPTFGDK